MDSETRAMLWDINFALNGKPTKGAIGPTSYTTFAGEAPDRFRVCRDGKWFEITARPLASVDAQ